jgi:Ca2+-binding EF-hand superfamily protein
MLVVAWMFIFASAASAQDTREFFEETDLDHNGVIDRQEYRRRMVEVFYFADKNKDGVVTIEELRAVGPVDPEKFRAADKKGDGALTLEEFVEYRMTNFDAADTNKDGVLTFEEVQAWKARAR